MRVLTGMVLLAVCGCGSGGGSSNSVFIAKATSFTVSGTVTSNNTALAGVKVVLSGGGRTYTGATNSSGKYTITVANGSYTVTPSCNGYAFTPQTLTVNGQNVTVSEITGTVVPTYTVSGAVTVGGAGLNGVNVTISDSTRTYTGTTDSSGHYAVSGVQGGSYTANLSLVGYAISPQNQSVVVNGANVTLTGATATVIPPAMVYVSSKDGNVYAINANTLAIEKTIALGVPYVSGIAINGDKLWYTWSDARYSWGYVGCYNLTTSENKTKVINGNGIYEGILRIVPSQPTALYIAFQGLSPATVKKYDISGDTPQVVATYLDECSDITDLAFSADGSKLWPSCQTPSKIIELSTSDLKPTGTTFATNGGPQGIDSVSVNGTEVIAVSNTGWYEDDLVAFPVNAPTTSKSYELGKNGRYGNIALSANGDVVYVLEWLNAGSDPTVKLVTLYRSSGTHSSVDVSIDWWTFNNGIAVDYLSGRVFVASLDSVSVFDSGGRRVSTISSIPGASSLVIVQP